MSTSSAIEAYVRNGVQYMTYEFLGETHVIGEDELKAIGLIPRPGFVEYAEEPPLEPRQMSIETKMDMMLRPGATEFGSRPAYSQAPRQESYKLTDDEKEFINDTLWGYPGSTIALAVGLNANTVTTYIRNKVSPKNRRSVRIGFGEAEAIKLRRKYIDGLIEKYSRLQW